MFMGGEFMVELGFEELVLDCVGLILGYELLQLDDLLLLVLNVQKELSVSVGGGCEGFV